MTNAAKAPKAQKTSKLAAAASKVTKTILGADFAQPAMVKLPKAVHELHLSPKDIIPAGAIITPEIAELADLDDDAIEELVLKEAIVMVDVLASALDSAPAADAE